MATRERQEDQRQALALVGLVALLAAARVWVIVHCPEPDGDAKGHLAIAAALVKRPWSVAVHWVWPPAYHYLLAALVRCGFTSQHVRLLNCGLACLLPFFVWRYGRRTIQRSMDDPARLVPFHAGLLCVAMPVVNLLGTSAQPGTLFAILVLASAWGIDTNRFVVAGCTLAVASMVRYEAWGAVGFLVGLRAVGCLPWLRRCIPAPLERVALLPPVVVVPSIVTIAGWFLAHRMADGSWLGFVRELYRYTRVQRDTFQQGLLWFPVVQPYYLFGLTLPLGALGTRQAWRPGFVVPLGIYAFLLLSYTFKGALGSGRYYESLTPFVCLSAAYGVAALGARWRPAMTVTFAAAFAHVVWLLVLNGRWTFHF